MSYAKYRLQGYSVLNSYLKATGSNLKADDLARLISPSPDIIGQLGSYYVISEISQNELDDAMETLALKADGIPSAQTFFDAIKSKMDSTFSYVVKYAAIESAKDIGAGVEKVAAASLDIVKLAYYLIPVAILAGLYVAYKKIEKAAK